MAYSFGPWPPLKQFFLVQIQTHVYKFEIPKVILKRERFTHTYIYIYIYIYVILPFNLFMVLHN